MRTYVFVSQNLFKNRRLTRWLNISAQIAGSGVVVLTAFILLIFKEKSIWVYVAISVLMLAFLAYTQQWAKNLGLLLFATVFFSVEVELPGGFALVLPSEPLVLVLAGIAAIQIISKDSELMRMVKNPVVALVGAYLLIQWQALPFSTMQMVSAKYVFIQTIYIFGVFVMFLLLFRQQKISTVALVNVFVFPALFFGAYALYNLWPYRFHPGAASLIAEPFFKDHTIFSATFSLVLPLFFLGTIDYYQPKIWRWLCAIATLATLVALLISTSRAAWLAILLVAFFVLFIIAGGKRKLFMVLMVISLIGAYFYFPFFEEKLHSNPFQSTTEDISFQEQALSAGNLSSDVSNVERINRWKCALRMGLEKPLTGFGPGTYQFQYLPYQRQDDMTYISVTSPHNTIPGRGGSAHSEYFLLLAENGMAAIVIWLVLQVVLLWQFFKIWESNLPEQKKWQALAIYAGLATFTIHSLFNNYLNQAHFAVVWWILLAAFTHISLQLKNSEPIS